MQELSGRAAWELGVRLTRRGMLSNPEQIRQISLEQAVAAAGGAPLDVEPTVADELAVSRPLPARFHLSETGRPIEEHDRRGEHCGHWSRRWQRPGPGHPRLAGSTTRGGPGDDHLTPGLGPLLPRLGGIIAETGSVLSHLAILARESGVPTVVGFPGALQALPEGAVVSLNGDTGEVARHDQHNVRGET